MTLTAVVTGDRVGDDEQQVTDLIAAAAAGDRMARYRLMAVVQPAVLRYCRARLGSGDIATEAARRVCRTVVATVSDLPDSVAKVHAFIHGIAVELVDEVPVPHGLPGMPGMLALLSPAQREVLVLRVAVGLSAEETASALGSTPGAVRHIQHHALERIRSAS
jgi:RNA polymerase sigma-70 factor (ECF subfamily)